MTREPTDTGSTAAAGGRHEHMCGSASHPDEEGVDVEWSLLKPSGVVDDERECTETDLTALYQSSARKHDQRDRKNRNFSNQVLRFPPHGGRQLSWF